MNTHCSRAIDARPLARFLPALALTLVAVPAAAGVVTIEADRDVTLFESADGCCASGAGVFLFAGDKNDGSVNRALFHFDVAGAVPAGATIVAARLDLNLSRSRAGTENMSLHRMLADWGEGTSDSGLGGPGSGAGSGAPATQGDATWLHSSWPSTFWSTPGGDFDPQPSATELMAGATGVGPQAISSVNMLPDVQSWLDDPAGNYGWVLKAEAETAPRSARRFDSRENADPGLRPRLEILFLSALGTSYCTGAVNSTGNGASLSAEGCAVADLGLLTLRAEGLPAGVPGLFFFGGSQVQAPLGDGFLCVGGPKNRLWPPAVADGSGVATREVDFLLPSAAPIVAGADLNFQAWYRDPAAGLAGSNTTDGLNIVFQ